MLYLEVYWTPFGIWNGENKGNIITSINYNTFHNYNGYVDNILIALTDGTGLFYYIISQTDRKISL